MKSTVTLFFLFLTKFLFGQHLCKDGILNDYKEGFIGPASTTLRHLIKQGINTRLEEFSCSVYYSKPEVLVYTVNQQADLLYYECYYDTSYGKIKEQGYYRLVYINDEIGYCWEKDLVWNFFDENGRLRKKEYYDRGELKFPLVTPLENSLISTIAFGSCGKQDKPQPILSLAASKKPDVFVFLGDNIYGDTDDMNVLRKKYAQLGEKKEFKQLRDSSQVLATWDDHDYGRNDAGRHYPFKKESKEIFLDFWKVPKDDVRQQREGIYTSYFYEGNGRAVQIILLDLRTFRDELRPYNKETVDKKAFHYGLDYWPYETADSALMGETQWTWLKEQFLIPADVRIIASSTQFGITWNSYEAWANFPHEQKRMLNLIKETKANGVVFISGDVHYAEISQLKEDGLYPIYDITSSGITSTWDFATPNFNRVDGPVMENHFGMIEIDWQQGDPELTFKIIDVKDKLRIERKVKLSELQF